MKTLIVFYSRTGNTKKVGEALAIKLDAEIEEIRDTVDRSGARGYLISGRDAMKRKLTDLEALTHDLNEYNLIVIGTPIWGWNMSVPIRTFLTQNKGKFKNVAFFCTMGGSGDKKAFSEMEEIIGKKPLDTLALKDSEVRKNNFVENLDKFVNQLNKLG